VNKGSRELGVLTAGGEVRLKRCYFWNGKAGGSCPADALLGVDGPNITPGARQLCCLMAIGQDFDQASADLLKVGGLAVGREKLRQITEGEGKAVQQVRGQGQLPAAWSAQQAKLPDGRSRVYGGVDGVMAPMVAQAEKDKRRQQHITRRQQRGKAKVGNTKGLPPPKPGTDERYKEMKIGVFYDQDRKHRHAFATEKLGDDFGPLLKVHARQIGFGQADQTICLFDGAVWILHQVCLALLSLQAILLDFYHSAEHVHAAARICITDEQLARQWVADRLAEAKRSDVTAMLAAINALEKKVRSPAKKQSLQGLAHYIDQRREMLDYAKALHEGRDIGSGPTEATCKTLTLRIKRPGMKWNRDNAAAMMNLLALRESGQWNVYWTSQTARAA
jgi:hypothetical protein